MLIILRDGTQHHTSAEVGQFAVAAELATLPPPPAPRPQPDLQWHALRGNIVGDTEEPPCVRFYCRGCGAFGVGNPPKERAYKQAVNHCGTENDTIPRHIADEYLELREDYLRRHR